MMSRAFPFSPLAMATAGKGPEGAACAGEPLAGAVLAGVAGGGVSSAAGDGAAARVVGSESKSDACRLREAVTRAACVGCG